MDPYTACDSYSEKQDHPIYCAGPQDSEDVLCEGSDGEQSFAEIKTKRRRYEEVGRRYLSGHRPLIQSATFRGPLNRESGWVNPWRSRSRKEEEWWQPGSEGMLFTRENVMRRAADHGVGYLSPAEALAWCKDAAEAEAREQFDSLDVAPYSGPSEIEDMREETEDLSPARLNADHPLDPGHSTRNPSMVNTSADATKDYEFADSNMKATKRLANAHWLKGSYVSKQARWEDTPQASPTPLPNLAIERDGRPLHKLKKPAGSHTRQFATTSNPTTPWFQDAQHWGRISRRMEQESHSRNKGQTTRPEADDLDELHDYSQVTFVSASDFVSSSQVKSKPSKPKSISFYDLEPDDLMAVSPKSSSVDSQAKRSDFSVQNPFFGSNQLPILSRSPDNHGIANLGDDISLVTEVAPSSKNLRNFQYHRKKQRKLNINQANESREGSHHLSITSRLLLEPPPAVRAEELNCGINAQNGAVGQPSESILTEAIEDKTVVPSDSIRPLPVFVPALVAEELDDEASTRNDPAVPLQMDFPKGNFIAEPETSSDVLQLSWPAVSSEGSLWPMHAGRASSRSKQSDDNYSKKIALLPANILPDLKFSSPFALFGQFGGNKPTPTNNATIGSTSKLQHSNNNEYDLDFPASRDTTLDMAIGLEISEDAQHATASSWTVETATGLATPFQILEDADNAVGSDKDELALVDAAPPSASSSYAERNSASIAQSRPASPTVAKGDQTLYTEDVSPAIDTSASLDVTPTKDDLFQRVEGLDNAAPLEPSFQQSSFMSHTAPKPGESIAKTAQEAGIDEGSTHSFNTTTPESMRKPQPSPRFDMISHSRFSPVRQKSEIDVVQNVLSQQRRGSNSSENKGCDEVNSSQPSVSAAIVQLDVLRATLSVLDDEAQVFPVEEQESWQGCGPQSPWGSETIPQHNPSTIPNQESLLTTNHDSFVHIGTPSLDFEDSLHSDWQFVKRPITLHTDGIVLSKKIGSPISLPQQPRICLDQEVISDTQQLVEAATKNPWASNSKKRTWVKPRKRVSFGSVISGENLDSKLESSTAARQWPISPPPPQTSDQTREAESLDDGTPVVSKFKKHFSAASRYKRSLPRNGDSQLGSPAVGAMAERFIGADRAASTQQERLSNLLDSPTHHLQPKNDSRTNIPPETIDYDLDVNLEDVLGDAGEFLNDWSVDFEIKKVRDLKGKRDGSSTTSKRKEFEFLDSWS